MKGVSNLQGCEVPQEVSKHAALEQCSFRPVNKVGDVAYDSSARRLHLLGTAVAYACGR